MDFVLKPTMPDFGLCCMFYETKINFKTYTWKLINSLIENKRFEEARSKIIHVWKHNIETTQKCIDYCLKNNIKSYRVSSDIFPHFHRSKEILGDISEFSLQLSKINKYDLKLSLHPGQFVNLGSNCENVLKNSLQDLDYHFFVADSIGFKEINIHVGGVYNDKKNTTDRFCKNMINFFSQEKRKYITLENDEINYCSEDLIEICNRTETRFTFDLHHHRCYSLKHNGLTEEEAFKAARSTWNEYQRMHISSPREGYISAMKSRPHSLFINPDDFPEWLLYYDLLHIDVEAKAKEDAIVRLRKYLRETFSL